jgi:hypothetical protein|tara:strand:+ start:461 stop:616 length:156 start_codon:yes stop_codon:yes gene_type:complete
MTDAQFEALKKRGAKAAQLGYEARAVIDELVQALVAARAPKPKPKVKKVAS